MSAADSHEDEFAWIMRMTDDDWKQLASLDPCMHYSATPEQSSPEMPCNIAASSKWSTMHSGCQLPDNRSQGVNGENQVTCLVDGRTLTSSTPSACPLTSGDLNVDNSFNDEGSSSLVKNCRAQSSHRQQPRDLKCSFAGCQHHGTFSRKYELDRHIAVKHQDEKPYTCPVVGCFKGRKAPAFAREDKLTAHLRALHTAAQPGRCVEKLCTVEVLPLDLLVVHARLSHLRPARFSPLTPHVHAIALAHGNRAEKCPFWACRKSLKPTTFADHILSHSTEEVSAMQKDLLAIGYRIIQADGRDTPSVMLTCPLCSMEMFNNHDEFEGHIIERHILRQEALAHWRAWYEFIRADNTHLELRVRDQPEARVPWKKWKVSLKEAGECPFCNHPVRARYQHDDHHLQFLRNEEEVIAELYPHRREILRKFPHFWSHPVFNDLDRTTPAE